VVVRDDGASPHSLQHSLNEAYTALTYREPSGDYGKRAAANFPASAGALNLERSRPPLSGSPGSPNAPGGATDAKCAQAGIDRIASGLGG